MPLRAQIEELRSLPDDELVRRADEAEDAVQRGLVAVMTGELWLAHLRRERASAIEAGEGRVAALQEELEEATRSTEAVRRRVVALAARTQALGIGAPHA